MSKVAVIGAGYVGLTTAACLADLGNDVVVVDINREKIAQLKERKKELQSLAQDLEKSGGTQVSLTDPDSRAMSMGRGSTVGYNVQAAVDALKSDPRVDPRRIAVMGRQVT